MIYNKTMDIGKILKELKEKHPDMDKKQMIAMAMSKMGAKKDNNKGAVDMALKMIKK